MPVVACPHAGDMAENAARLRWAGLGVSLPRRFHTAARACAWRCGGCSPTRATPSARAARARLVRAHDGAAAAADELEAFARAIALCPGDGGPPSVARVTRPPSLWIDREGHAIPTPGRSRRRAGAGRRWRRRPGGGRRRSQEPRRRRRAGRAGAGSCRRWRSRRRLPRSALSLVAVLGGRDDQADLLPAAAGGSPRPTQIGRVYQSAGPGVVSVQVGSALRHRLRRAPTTARSSPTPTWSATPRRRRCASATAAALVEAEVLGTDPSSDLAVLRVDPGDAGPLRPLPLADSDRVQRRRRRGRDRPSLRPRPHRDRRASSPGSAARSRRPTASRSTR